MTAPYPRRIAGDRTRASKRAYGRDATRAKLVQEETLDITTRGDGRAVGVAEVCVDLDDGRGPRAPEKTLRAQKDLPYFVAVAEVAAALVPGIARFVISCSRGVEPLLSSRDVWFLIRDERAIPFRRPPICPVFRTYGDWFHFPSRGLPRDPLLTGVELAQWARNRAHAIYRSWPRRRDRSGHSRGWLPLGFPSYDAIPQTVPAVEERPVDVTFRGSVGGGRRYGPKTISRRRMISAVQGLPKDVVVDLRQTRSFEESCSLGSSSYVNALLESKICLAPRGRSLETFRVFEAAASGCVLITEPLPPAWFYAGLARREVSSWSQLPYALDDLLSNPELMTVMATAAREWALDVVSPSAIGRWVARRLGDERR